ncbi:MAG: hypothetical protein KDI98_08985 [Hyphomicrobiaceae bacterium]|nr:hypothetical protein [Hyphomicrobiaceae bacterium]
MSLRTTLAAAVIGFATLATPASASGITFDFGFYGPNGAVHVTDRGGHRGGRYGDRHGPRYQAELPVRAVARQLRHQGFRHVQFRRERGQAYVFTARGFRGAPVRVVVNKYSGNVLRVVRH